MLLFPGDYTISGSRLIPAFCIDSSFKSPADTYYFKKGTTNITVTKVSSGTLSRPISIDSALRVWIRISGVPKSVISDSSARGYVNVWVTKKRSGDRSNYILSITNGLAIIGSPEQGWPYDRIDTLERIRPLIQDIFRFYRNNYRRLQGVSGNEFRVDLDRKIIWPAVERNEDAAILRARLNQMLSFFRAKMLLQDIFSDSSSVYINFVDNYYEANNPINYYRLEWNTEPNYQKAVNGLVPVLFKQLSRIDNRFIIIDTLSPPDTAALRLIQTLTGISLPPNTARLFMATAGAGGSRPPIPPKISFLNSAECFQFLNKICCDLLICISHNKISAALECGDVEIEVSLSGDGLEITLNARNGDENYSMNLFNNGKNQSIPAIASEDINLNRKDNYDSLQFQEFAAIYHRYTQMPVDSCEMITKICVFNGLPVAVFELKCNDRSIIVSTSGNISLSATEGNVTRTIDLNRKEQECDH
jgi:hypothetical protein